MCIGVSTPHPPLKSANCPSPLFRQSPPIYWFFVNLPPPPLLKIVDFSVNLHNIKSFTFNPILINLVEDSTPTPPPPSAHYGELLNSHQHQFLNSPLLHSCRIQLSTSFQPEIKYIYS